MKERQKVKNNLILIGFMGCGKTSVGEALAKRLSFSFLDTDEAIEKKEGKKISAIFEESGEKAFRDMETNLLLELFDTTEKTVISTGGGLVLREENGKILQKLGFVVYLDVTVETVLERLKNDKTRPLLNGENKEERVKKLLDFRRPIYEYTAYLTLDTNKREIEKITEEIVRNYELMTTRGIDKEGVTQI
jgi:shikimate kinase